MFIIYDLAVWVFAPSAEQHEGMGSIDLIRFISSSQHLMRSFKKTVKTPLHFTALNSRSLSPQHIIKEFG